MFYCKKDSYDIESMLKLLIAQGADPYKKNYYGENLFYYLEDDEPFACGYCPGGYLTIASEQDSSDDSKKITNYFEQYQRKRIAELERQVKILEAQQSQKINAKRKEPLEDTGHEQKSRRRNSF